MSDRTRDFLARMWRRTSAKRRAQGGSNVGELAESPADRAALREMEARGQLRVDEGPPPAPVREYEAPRTIWSPDQAPDPRSLKVVTEDREWQRGDQWTPEERTRMRQVVPGSALERRLMRNPDHLFGNDLADRISASAVREASGVEVDPELERALIATDDGEEEACSQWSSRDHLRACQEQLERLVAVPFGSWQLTTNEWRPNFQLQISPARQHELNLRNAFSDECDWRPAARAGDTALWEAAFPPLVVPRETEETTMEAQRMRTFHHSDLPPQPASEQPTLAELMRQLARRAEETLHLAAISELAERRMFGISVNDSEKDRAEGAADAPPRERPMVQQFTIALRDLEAAQERLSRSLARICREFEEPARPRG
jgi:hypothetical protein